MRVHFEPDHRFMLAGDCIGKAAQGRVELVIVDDVAADQHIAVLHQLGETGAHVGIHRHREGVDRDVGENGFLLTRGGARGNEKADAALKIGIGGIDRGQCVRHQRRQIRRPVRPFADHIIAVGAEQDARRPGLRGRDVGDEGFEELLLLIEDGVRIARLFGIGEPCRRPHRTELRLQHIVVGARRIEGDIDADRFRAHQVEIAERVREQGAVERRANAGVEQGLVIIGDEGDATVLFDLGRHQRRARVIERAFGSVDQRHLPAEARDQDRGEQEDDRRRHPRRAELHDQPAHALAERHRGALAVRRRRVRGEDDGFGRVHRISGRRGRRSPPVGLRSCHCGAAPGCRRR